MLGDAPDLTRYGSAHPTYLNSHPRQTCLAPYLYWVWGLRCGRFNLTIEVSKVTPKPRTELSAKLTTDLAACTC